MERPPSGDDPARVAASPTTVSVRMPNRDSTGWGATHYSITPLRNLSRAVFTRLDDDKWHGQQGQMPPPKEH